MHSSRSHLSPIGQYWSKGNDQYHSLLTGNFLFILQLQAGKMFIILAVGIYEGSVLNI